MRRLKLPEEHEGFRPVEPEGPLDDDVIVCRCEEITAGEIRKAIRKYHATTVTEVKRRVRAGMGLCQGRTCGKLVSRIIAEETGKKMSEIQGSTDRPPVRPVTFGELAEDGEDQEG
ncbi:MAG TPA: (2Fe-2S)-binding protein [Sellimonas intestinalis]|nr:(2Fe-2S)-binding protein [Sellimonas intestinalis]HJE99761.1 (2Fe-2S)-binding protein [Sellimonas intestinalis]